MEKEMDSGLGELGGAWALWPVHLTLRIGAEGAEGKEEVLQWTLSQEMIKRQLLALGWREGSGRGRQRKALDGLGSALEAHLECVCNGAGWSLREFDRAWGFLREAGQVGAPLGDGRNGGLAKADEFGRFAQGLAHAENDQAISAQELKKRLMGKAMSLGLGDSEWCVGALGGEEREEEAPGCSMLALTRRMGNQAQAICFLLDKNDWLHARARMGAWGKGAALNTEWASWKSSAPFENLGMRGGGWARNPAWRRWAHGSNEKLKTWSEEPWPLLTLHLGDEKNIEEVERAASERLIWLFGRELKGEILKEQENGAALQETDLAAERFVGIMMCRAAKEEEDNLRDELGPVREVKKPRPGI